MVDVKMLHGRWFVWYNDRLVIVTVSLIYATTMGEVLQDAKHR